MSSDFENLFIADQADFVFRDELGSEIWADK